MKKWFTLAIKKNSFISVAKAKNIVVFVLTYSMLYGDFRINLYSVDSDEAMKRLMFHCFNVSKVLNTSAIHRYKFLLCIYMLKHYCFFEENHHLTLHRRYFFLDIPRLMLHQDFFLT